MCTHEAHRRAAAEAGAIAALLTSLKEHTHSAPAAAAVSRALAAVLGGGGRVGRGGRVAVQGSLCKQDLERPLASHGLRRKREVVEGGGVAACVRVVWEHGGVTGGDARAVSAAASALRALSCACARPAGRCGAPSDPSLVFAGREAPCSDAPRPSREAAASPEGSDDDAAIAALDVRHSSDDDAAIAALDVRHTSKHTSAGGTLVCAHAAPRLRAEIGRGSGAAGFGGARGAAVEDGVGAEFGGREEVEDGVGAEVGGREEVPGAAQGDCKSDDVDNDHGKALGLQALGVGRWAIGLWAMG